MSLTAFVVILLKCAAAVVVGILAGLAIDRWVGWPESHQYLKAFVWIVIAIFIVVLVLPLAGL